MEISMELTEMIKLINTVSESNLESFTIEQGDLKVSLKNGKVYTILSEEEQDTVNVHTSGQRKQIQPEDNSQYIKSPLVGVFYITKAEGAEPFVSIGDEVKKGQPVGIIEAMKLMNEVFSPFDGIVEEILLENEQTVEYGQPLIRIKSK